MSDGFQLYPLIFSFSILLVFLHRFYQRYFRPCIQQGERDRVLTGGVVVVVSIAMSIVLRFFGL